MTWTDLIVEVSGFPFLIYLLCLVVRLSGRKLNLSELYFVELGN